MKEIYTEKYRQIGLKIAYYRKLRGLTQEELAEQGIKPNTIRLSIGTEHIDDILADIEQALNSIG